MATREELDTMEMTRDQEARIRALEKRMDAIEAPSDDEKPKAKK